ncbi:hypothetical protein [Streptomyces sp. NPDC056069]|uniref:hypothetical protein n=1 Tax=Streptomyces sp. NPDC056069 TaxID=3345702 RepID=UPI0035E32ABA
MTALSRIAVMLAALDPRPPGGVVSLLRARPEISLVDTVGPAVDTQVVTLRNRRKYQAPEFCHRWQKDC